MGTVSDGDLFRKRVPVTSAKHRDTLMFAAGMRTIVDALKDSQCVLPGMKLAIAIGEAALAKEQISIASHAYREAAKAGVDLSAVPRLPAPDRPADDLWLMILLWQNPRTRDVALDLADANRRDNRKDNAR
jgi:hypothetical protein